MRQFEKLKISRALLMAGLLFCCISCKKNESPEAGGHKVVQQTGSTAEYSSDSPYNLNVIYFIGKDRTPDTAYQQRISSYMLQCQDFYRTWMDKNGYGKTTFGLLKNSNNLIKITTITGVNDQAYYVSAKSGVIRSEVDAYFAAHPSEKTSETLLMIMGCKDHDDANGRAFFGYVGGNSCFAVDYPTMFEDAKAGKTAYIGGLFHELGHGLGLAHNGGLKTDCAANGTSLMGAGNTSYLKSPTFLTLADCATLYNNQCFSATTKTGWYMAPVTSISRIHAKVQDNNIIVSGKYTANATVNSLNFYNDPGTYDAGGNIQDIGTNKDYDTSVWTKNPRLVWTVFM
ncbi:hypothetical protein [Pedobacter sp. NJ-S-72]